ncbi:MAG: threonylcarbamoyl-AMP synthase, partial [Rhodobacteraceae bacterium]|nr:threonylcarbamoyl-AMP synthase [Paracoccaceae bacterium]
PRPPVVALDAPDALERASRVLASGGTAVLPTDTVYGVAALAELPRSTDKLFALKDRAAAQPVAVLVANVEQALELVAAPAEDPARWMATLWPGPLTLVLPRSARARDLTLGGDPASIGVRCPDHDFSRALASELGPLATTSANRSGQPTATDAHEAAASLVGEVDLVVDGGPAGTLASTVVDASVPAWSVLREGAIGAD